MAAVADPATVDLDEDEELALWAENVLRNALDEMRRRWPTNAEVIRLFYGVGATGETPVSLSVSEIASRLSCAPNAVHQALHRGRKRLRGCLQNELVRLVGVNEMTSEIPLIVGALGRTRRGLIDE